jgi:iron complex transport system substrate-binding protein
MAAVPPRLTSRFRIFLALCVLGVLGGSYDTRTQADPRRIVSLIPATTEMLFEIGVSDRIAGVGTFDRFPPEVSRFPRVGGLLDPNVERILSLKPDLVIVYETQTDLISQLTRAGVPLFRYRHQGLPDILQTMRALGTRIGAVKEAEAAASTVEARLTDIRRRVEGRPRPRTLLIHGRDPGSLQRINASGGYGFLHDLLELAGGNDVLSDFKRQSVEMSAEMVLARAPEVIIELQYGDSPRRKQIDAETRVWDALPSVPAVRRKQVHVLVGDEFVVPGPRIAQAAERFARTLHPDVFR